MVKKVVVHEVPVALIVLSGEAYVLIHIEGNYVFEGNLTFFIHLNKILVNSERGGSCGKAENKGAILFMIVDGVCNMLRSPITHCLIIVFDD